MNEISLDKFKQEIDQVRDYLKHVEYVDKISSHTFDQSVLKSVDELIEINEFKGKDSGENESGNEGKRRRIN